MEAPIRHTISYAHNRIKPSRRGCQHYVSLSWLSDNEVAKGIIGNRHVDGFTGLAAESAVCNDGRHVLSCIQWSAAPALPSALVPGAVRGAVPGSDLIDLLVQGDADCVLSDGGFYRRCEG
jgi:hypothetical protein